MTKKMVFDHTHPLWNTFLDFHLGRYDGNKELRHNAKVLLFPIHYGTMDTTRAFHLIRKMKEEGRT